MTRTSDARKAHAATTKWSAIQRFNRVDQRPLEEDICAENDFAFFDYNVAPLPHAVESDF